MDQRRLYHRWINEINDGSCDGYLPHQWYAGLSVGTSDYSLQRCLHQFCTAARQCTCNSAQSPSPRSCLGVWLDLKLFKRSPLLILTESLSMTVVTMTAEKTRTKQRVTLLGLWSSSHLNGLNASSNQPPA